MSKLSSFNDLSDTVISHVPFLPLRVATLHLFESLKRNTVAKMLHGETILCVADRAEIQSISQEDQDLKDARRLPRGRGNNVQDRQQQQQRTAGCRSNLPDN